MNRFHRKIYFEKDAEGELNALCERLNAKKWGYTIHALENIKQRELNIEGVLRHIKTIKFEKDKAFEYYKKGNKIEKAVFRFPFDVGRDVCVVVDKDKTLVTLYMNNKNDEHITLNKSIYTKAGAK